MLKRFIGYYGPHKKLFIIDMLCAIIAAAIDLIFPYVSRNSMENLLPRGAYRTFFVVMAVLIYPLRDTPLLVFLFGIIMFLSIFNTISFRHASVNSGVE